MVLVLGRRERGFFPCRPDVRASFLWSLPSPSPAHFCCPPFSPPVFSSLALPQSLRPTFFFSEAFFSPASGQFWGESEATCCNPVEKGKNTSVKHLWFFAGRRKFHEEETMSLKLPRKRSDLLQVEIAPTLLLQQQQQVCQQQQDQEDHLKAANDLSGRIRRYSDRMISSCKDLAQECTVLLSSYGR